MFNVELAKKHPDCLEYIVVHEMAHHPERNHGHRFISSRTASCLIGASDAISSTQHRWPAKHGDGVIGNFVRGPSPIAGQWRTEHHYHPVD